MQYTGECAPGLVHEWHSMPSYTLYLPPDVLAAALAVSQPFDLGAQALQAGRELTGGTLGVLVICHTWTLADALEIYRPA